MMFGDSLFFLPPEDDDSDRYHRICRASKERMRISSIRRNAADYFRDGHCSPRKTRRICGMESDCPGTRRDSSDTRDGQPKAEISFHSPGQRIASACLRHEKLELIRRKIASGYYHTSGHLEELAEVLVEKIDFLGPDEDSDLFDPDDE